MLDIKSGFIIQLAEGLLTTGAGEVVFFFLLLPRGKSSVTQREGCTGIEDTGGCLRILPQTDALFFQLSAFVVGALVFNT